MATKFVAEDTSAIFEHDRLIAIDESDPYKMMIFCSVLWHL